MRAHGLTYTAHKLQPLGAHNLQLFGGLGFRVWGVHILQLVGIHNLRFFANQLRLLGRY